MTTFQVTKQEIKVNPSFWMNLMKIQIQNQKTIKQMQLISMVDDDEFDI